MGIYVIYKLQKYSDCATYIYNSKLTFPVVQLFVSMSMLTHVPIKAVWVMLTRGPLTALPIREYRSSHRYNLSSTLYNHFLIVGYIRAYNDSYTHLVTQLHSTDPCI